MAWKNARRFRKKLSRLPKVIQAAARQAMAEFADEVVEAMKSLVPVKSGALRDSIGWTWGHAPVGSKIIGAVKSSETENRITIYAGSEAAFYARWVEFGTKERGPGRYRDESGKKRNAGARGHAATKAEPYFYPTWRAKKRVLARRINPKVYKAIKLLAADQSGDGT